MGAWQYCQKCDSGMDEPTAVEIAEGERECRSCGTWTHTVIASGSNLVAMAELIDQLNERVEELEQRLSDAGL